MNLCSIFKSKKKPNIYVTDAMSLDGKKLPLNVSLPLKNELNIPEDTVEVIIYSHFDNCDYPIYRIFIGKKDIVRDFFKIGSRNVPPFEIMERIGTIDDLDSTICYIVDERGIRNAYAILRKDDIIVDNLDEMKEFIYGISNDYSLSSNNMTLKRSLK